MEKDILDEIGKKSQEIMRSNEELASRLRRSQDSISMFNKELALLKSGGGEIDVSIRSELEKMKSDLEEKRQVLKTLIDDLEPLELDLAKKEDVINLLSSRVDDQTSRIESLSKELVSSKGQLQQFIDENSSMKQQVAEKDALLKVVKDRLSEKTSLLKDAEDKVRNLEQQLDASKKQLFSLDNKAKAVESRVFSTGEQNQKLLYELMKQKERLKSLEADAAEKTRLLAARENEYSQSIELLQKEEEEKRVMLMQNHAKRIAAMNASLALLKAKMEQQSRILDQRSAKERALINDFNARMRELATSGNDSLPDINIDLGPAEPVEEEPSYTLSEPAADSGVTFPSKLDEIMPVIEMALDHGDDLEQVRHSLVSSGYSKRDIEDAISKLNIVEK